MFVEFVEEDIFLSNFKVKLNEKLNLLMIPLSFLIFIHVDRLNFFLRNYKCNVGRILGT